MKNYATPNKILAVARELHLTADSFHQVGPSQWASVLKRIFQEFATTSETGITWLWQQLKHEGVSTQTEHNNLSHLSTLFENESKVWVVFEDWDHTKKNGSYWLFEGNFGSAINVLNNMHGIEYYIVDKKMHWMVMENHHDILIAVGEPAESRLLAFKKARQDRSADSGMT